MRALSSPRSRRDRSRGAFRFGRAAISFGATISFGTASLGAIALAAAALAGCEGWVGAPPDEGGSCEAPEIVPGARLLTRFEYARTVADLLGTTDDPTSSFPPEPSVNGMTNDSATHLVNPLLVEELGKAAKRLADEARDRGFEGVVDCDAIDRACVERFIRVFGRRAYRRPLDENERASLLRLFERTSSALGADEALAAVLEAMLSSPQFLYRVEAPLGPSRAAEVELGAFELASRLSYTLAGTTPDDELLDAAADGSLLEPNRLDHEARRLLASPRARTTLREFVRRWLGLDRFRSLVRQDAPPDIGRSLEESLLRYFDEVFWSAHGDLPLLFSSRALHLDRPLAQVLGVPFEGDDDWMRSETEEARGGLLGQPGIVSLLAHTDQSSPILRGVFVREKLLCSPVPAPPPDVDNTPPDPDPGLTTRERFFVHTEDPSCSSCHRLIDPLGFGFENYDHLGRLRAEENGRPIDVSGEIVDGPDDALDGPFDGTAELGARLGASRAVLDCLARTWMTFALGRPTTTSDACSHENVVEEALEASGRLDELVLALVRTPAFRRRANPPALRTEGAP